MASENTRNEIVEKIVKIKTGSTSSFICPKCQPLKARKRVGARKPMAKKPTKKATKRKAAPRKKRS